MTEYTWPGNVRQLQHLMERLSILAPEGKVDDAAVREAIEAGKRVSMQPKPSPTLKSNRSGVC